MLPRIELFDNIEAVKSHASSSQLADSTVCRALYTYKEIEPNIRKINLSEEHG